MFGLWKKPAPVAVNNDPIGSALMECQIKSSEPVDKEYIKTLRQGTSAECDYANVLDKSRESQEDLSWILARSQQIDLGLLLSARDKDGMPVWALASPHDRLERSYIRQSGTYVVPSIHSYSSDNIEIRVGRSLPNRIERATPKSFPILPQRVREMVNDQTNKTKAVGMAILYKESEWAIQTAPKAPIDPALIVWWRSYPSTPFCMAIWGREDRPQIQEFIK